MDQTLSHQPRFARKIAISVSCLLVTTGAGLYWLGNDEREDDPQLVAAIQGLHKSGAEIRAIAFSELTVPIPGAELLVPLLPDSVVAKFVTLRLQREVQLDGDQVNDANLAHLRNLHDLAELEISNATLSDKWIDYLREVTADVVVGVANCTAQSDSGQAFLAELQQANTALISQLAPAMIAPATDQASSPPENEIQTIEPQVEPDE